MLLLPAVEGGGEREGVGRGRGWGEGGGGEREGVGRGRGWGEGGGGESEGMGRGWGESVHTYSFYPRVIRAWNLLPQKSCTH